MIEMLEDEFMETGFLGEDELNDPEDGAAMNERGLRLDEIINKLLQMDFETYDEK